MKTRAVYDAAKDEWTLNGQKTWISNGGIANVHVVVAVVDPDAGHARAGVVRRRTEYAGAAAGREVQEDGHPRIAHGRGIPR